MMVVSNDFILEIIRPSKSQLLSVTWVEIEGITGSFTVGLGHSPLVAILKPGGVVTYNALEGGIGTLEVSGGTFSVSKGRAVILLDR